MIKINFEENIVLFLKAAHTMTSTIAKNRKIYIDFKEYIYKKNRYIQSGMSNLFLKELSKNINQYQPYILKEGDILFRSRIMDNDLRRKRYLEFYKDKLNLKNKELEELNIYFDNFDDKDYGSFYDNFFILEKSKKIKVEKYLRKRFKGYDAKNSMAPPAKFVKDGRLNPEKIPYLYTAEDEITTVYEIKPYIGQQVSIAKLKVLKDLKILDLTNTFKKEKNTITYKEKGYELEVEIESILEVISEEFRKPNYGNSFEYIVTQYITEYIKEILKYDGIRFWSSLKKDGKNIVLFDIESCKAISSKLISVENIDFSIKDFKFEFEK